MANGTGLVMIPLYETGIYLCVASNEVGTDSRVLTVTIVGEMYFAVVAAMITLGYAMIIFLPS